MRRKCALFRVQLLYNTSPSSFCNIAVISEREQDQRGNMLFTRAIGPFPVRTRTTRAIAPLIPAKCEGQQNSNITCTCKCSLLIVTLRCLIPPIITESSITLPTCSGRVLYSVHGCGIIPDSIASMKQIYKTPQTITYKRKNLSTKGTRSRLSSFHHSICCITTVFLPCMHGQEPC